MKKVVLLIFCVSLFMKGTAQDNQRPKFDPAKFRAAQEQFITQAAVLSPSEASDFFPVYNELQEKKRALFDRQRRLGMFKPTDNEGCVKAIHERDKLQLEMTKLEQSYHNKFLKVLPASKVYDVIKAEDKFHRQMLRHFSHHKDKD